MNRVISVARPSYSGVEWNDKQRAMVHQTMHSMISLALLTGLVKLRISGLEQVPATGAAILMSNHESNVDPFLIGYIVPRPMAIPGKAELFRYPGLSWLLRNLGSYPVERGEADVGALRTSIEALKEGRILSVFPEGSRSRTGTIGHFNPTLIKIAIRLRIPIVAVGLAGTEGLLPPGAALPTYSCRPCRHVPTSVRLA